MLVDSFMIALFSLCAVRSNAAAVTLYSVALPVPDLPHFTTQSNISVTYSAINPTPGSDVTTYEVQEVHTKDVVINSFQGSASTSTVLSTPTTFTYTLVEGQSEYHMTRTVPIMTPPDQTQTVSEEVVNISDCDLDTEKMKGTCTLQFVEVVQELTVMSVSGSPTTSTVFSTVSVFPSVVYTGILVPLIPTETSAAGSTHSSSMFGLIATLLVFLGAL
ncbi:hypothetical protein CVT24_000769 [Panaeolus cyanescens]|uniref:Uncharacterized protein n=1 Tax=Panaeolus cyanescens TaxID=181874 RepID=A0A409YZ62_9AGAR|nr:hypothetical protein CVT24_000769 [Panaeolus cyanescens]